MILINLFNIQAPKAPKKDNANHAVQLAKLAWEVTQLAPPAILHHNFGFSINFLV